MQTQRIVAALLPLCLLAGCGALPFGGGETTPATVETAATAPPQALTAYADAALAPALERYAESQGVTLTLTNDPAAAALLVTESDPYPLANCLDMSGDALLAAAAARAGMGEAEAVTALPLGKTLYGYWADSTALTALLGEGGPAALQTASWAEWSDFAETLTAWLAEGGEATVTLSGTDYPLPAERPAELTAGGVFGSPLSTTPGYTAALLAAGDEPNADTLTGPLNGVYSAVTLEWDNLAPEGTDGLLRRGRLSELLAAYGAENCQNMVLIPFKCELEDSDLTTEEYNLTGLLNYPVLADAGYLAINADADPDAQTAAKSAVLWLYSSGEGEAALTEALTLVTPWNTASDATALGAMQIDQVATGILPAATLSTAAADALTEAENALQGVEKRTTAQRTAYTQAAVAALVGAE